MDDWQDDWQNDVPNNSSKSGILNQTLRNVTILGVICLIALVFFAQTGSGDKTLPVEEQVGERPAAAQSANLDQDRQANQQELTISAGSHNQFFVEAMVNGVPVQFMVDTGATLVSLSPADAQNVGFNLNTLNYDQRMNTANGSYKVARINLDTIQIGSLEIGNVEGSAQTAGMSTTSLLGMSFLNRLESYEVRNNELVLSW